MRLTRVFTYPAIMLRSDCIIFRSDNGLVMAIRPHLPLDQRLLILRATDPLRTWNSLDDQRVCVLCRGNFSGRRIEISRNRAGEFKLRCPTDGRNSAPNQWVYPGNPLVSETAYPDWQSALIDTGTNTPASAAA